MIEWLYNPFPQVHQLESIGLKKSSKVIYRTFSQKIVVCIVFFKNNTNE
jgi:hypothetical protein